ncbi:hypothetical protein Bca52824_065544 [Brassica carinata]|uniref:Uncharacterized protein n=1 Tax=Brassica carinata TaxID=52824 RepID=A0A8X7UA33_BRACI|nr:hypothetical protein Bca52824_065544 [Brassica carinata]
MMLFTIVKYTSRVYMGGQGEKPSCSRNDASSDPGVKPWLIFKELQEFKPLPFIFPFLAGKKGMAIMAMNLDRGKFQEMIKKCNTFLLIMSRPSNKDLTHCSLMNFTRLCIVL